MQKVQFSAELQLLKHSCEPDDYDERNANSLMTPVYAEGLSKDSFVEMAEKPCVVHLRLFWKWMVA